MLPEISQGQDIVGCMEFALQHVDLGFKFCSWNGIILYHAALYVVSKGQSQQDRRRDLVLYNLCVRDRY